MDAAKARIEALNPLVSVQALRHPTLLEQESLDALVMSVDLVCVTDWDREGLVRRIISMCSSAFFFNHPWPFRLRSTKFAVGLGSRYMLVVPLAFSVISSATYSNTITLLRV